MGNKILLFENLQETLECFLHEDLNFLTIFIFPLLIWERLSRRFTEFFGECYCIVCWVLYILGSCLFSGPRHKGIWMLGPAGKGDELGAALVGLRWLGSY